MKIDMTPILSGETEVIPFDLSAPLGEEAAEQFRTDFDADFTSLLHLTGRVVNHSGYMSLEVGLSADYETRCARCLKELKFTASYSAEKPLAVRGTLQDEENEDYVIIDENELDLMPIAEELLLLELPQKHLCREECRGLCPKCGHDLNEGDCGCEKHEIDPRLAVLKQLITDSDK